MQNQSITPRTTFVGLLEADQPQAMAWVTGAPGTDLSGLVKFYQTPFAGVLVEAELFNLPDMNTPGSSQFYALHIHEFGDCTNSFQNTGEHYNPAKLPHPEHAGDLIPLLSNGGYAWIAFYTNRFTVGDILGRSVVIHSHPDDFTTQPSGNSGTKIGCGVIRAAHQN